MALNKYMHPRNIYKNKKPNFKALALKYPEFRKHATQCLTGQVTLDFKNPECLRALSLTLLKEDFDLDVQLPPDHLIPTIPLRLNYILWLEDILCQSEKIYGIDIGTGASCVYPLLGCQRNKWKFLATEADPVNAEFAQNNVDKNGMQDQITVIQVDPSRVLCDVLPDDNKTYDFCMCNPPFFGSHLEAWGLQTSRSEERPEPMSVNTPSDSESVVSGGEVEFITRIITDSVRLKDKIRVYSSMVGKKSSLSAVKQLLHSHKIEHFATTEFYQGRTMRWGIVWSFDPTVVFPKAPSKQIRKDEKGKAPIMYVVPPGVCSDKFNVTNVTKKLKSLLLQLQVHCKEEKGFASWWSVVMTAYDNTWSHQRRKRREKMRHITPEKAARISKDDEKISEEDQNVHLEEVNKHGNDSPGNSSEDKLPESGTLNDDSLSVQKSDSAHMTQQNDKNSPVSHQGAEHIPTISQQETKNGHRVVNAEVSDICDSSKDAEIDQSDVQMSSSSTEKLCPEKEQNLLKPGSEQTCSPVEETESYLVRCHLCLKKSGQNIHLEMKWMDGQNRECMHQILQHIKNHLK